MLTALTLIAALGTNQPSLPAGSYRYTATLNGTSAGSSTLTVKADGSTTQIDERASGAAAGLQFSGSCSLVLGADLAPTQYDGKYSVAGQQADVNVSLTPTTATVNNSAASTRVQTYALDPNAKHFVVIEPGLLAGLFALPAQMQAWNDAAVTAIAPAMGRQEPLQASAATTATRPSGVPAADVALNVVGPYAVIVWYDPSTLVPDEILVPSQNATVTRVRD